MISGASARAGGFCGTGGGSISGTLGGGVVAAGGTAATGGGVGRTLGATEAVCCSFVLIVVRVLPGLGASHGEGRLSLATSAFTTGEGCSGADSALTGGCWMGAVAGDEGCEIAWAPA